MHTTETTEQASLLVGGERDARLGLDDRVHGEGSGVFRRVWPWGCLGLIGSLLIALASPRVATSGAITWWYSPSLVSGRSASLAVVYGGMLALSVAWLGLGRVLARPGGVRPLQLWIVGALWLLPLALGPALFSHDVYSYLAQGTILHLGLSPYHETPSVLGQLGHAHVLAAVSPFWRHTTAPYGPLFLALISLIASISGSNLILGVLLIRLLLLAGIALLVVFVPRLARVLGTDPSRAVWLAILSPLVLLELVAAGHNDALMVGLMLAGVTLALERHPLLGITACALAATIKIPAAIGAVFIAVAWARTLPMGTGRLWFLTKGAAAGAGVFAVVSAATGLGLGWVSTTLFSTPAKVRLAITPSTGIGWTAGAVLHDLGISASSRGIESVLGVIAFGITVLFGAVLLWRARLENLVRYLGLLLIAAAAGGPAAWPWYFTWGLVLLAICPRSGRSVSLAVALAAAVFLVKPSGTLALPLGTAPVVVGAYAVIAAAAWYTWRRNDDDRGTAGRGPNVPGGAPSAVARS
jgi:alpha-1,6-mannosyltransferase